MKGYIIKLNNNTKLHPKNRLGLKNYQLPNGWYMHEIGSLYNTWKFALLLHILIFQQDQLLL